LVFLLCSYKSGSSCGFCYNYNLYLGLAQSECPNLQNEPNFAPAHPFTLVA